MTFTPLVYWRNVNLNNMKVILDIYPDLSNNITRKKASDILEEQYSGYKKTVYQFACQLGIEDRSVDYLKVHNYLFSFSDNYLKKYLEFWIKTYYAPNPYVTGTQNPVIFYKEIAKRILDSNNLQIDFMDFFHEMSCRGREEFLLNAIKFHGNPIKVKKIKNREFLYIDETDRKDLENNLNKVDKYFQIPKESKDKGLYFDRYNYKNFTNFHEIPKELEGGEGDEFNLLPSINKTIPHEYNRIVIGAPGTGKSYKLKIESEGNLEDKGCFLPKNIERVTFYSNYSYSQFIGTYKPRPKSNKRTAGTSDNVEQHYITYEYVPGPFLRLLVQALIDYRENHENSDNYLLIVEEINRVQNPAGVFGDIFQLLDRKSGGRSEYDISCSEEMQLYFKKEGLSDLEKLYLPPNFYIWATMNSADQGVHPLDSAFQRRWSPEYMDINENEEQIIDYNVMIKGYGMCNWNNFRRSLNERLAELNVKEDKLIGPFFLKEEELNDEDVNNQLGESKFQKAFKYKLIRYLSEDVFKYNKKELFGEYKYFTQLISAYDSDENIFNGLSENTFIINTKDNSAVD